MSTKVQEQGTGSKESLAKVGEALLWQTGYLTISGQLNIGAHTEYSLTYPYLEVQAGFNDGLLQGLHSDPFTASRHVGQLSAPAAQ